MQEVESKMTLMISDDRGRTFTHIYLSMYDANTTSETAKPEIQ